MKAIAILGSTGSIGRSALAVVEKHPDRLMVAGLAAGRRVEELAAQIQRHRPRLAAMASPEALDQLRAMGVDSSCTLTGAGREGLVAVAVHSDVELVLCASSGTEALEAVVAALEHGKTVALANKEILVMAGGLVTEVAKRRGVPILPVDSEHNAIHQCLEGHSTQDVRRLVLTASGGPFRGRDPSELAVVSAAEALRHPTWQMGRKITIDSATLMNKGLEVIEAHWLFGVLPQQIDVVIHPQSIVHSLVEFIDGSILAQLGVTDMRLPIQYAFSYPERWSAPVPSLDLVRAGPLDFDLPDSAAFPCLKLAYRALGTKRTLPIVLNAANEVAVARFLEGNLAFPGIPEVIARTMDAHTPARSDTVSHIRSIDEWARRYSQEIAREVQSEL